MLIMHQSLSFHVVPGYRRRVLGLLRENLRQR
jgi:hypothetical protein